MAGYYLQMKPIELSGRLALMTSQLKPEFPNTLEISGFRCIATVQLRIEVISGTPVFQTSAYNC